MAVINTKVNNMLLENKKFNESEIKQKKLILLSKPRFLTAVITKNCNLDCIMCDRVYNRKIGASIPYPVIKKIMSLLPFLEGINWQGGEVFLLDYFKELFTEVTRYSHIRQSIITNGLLINEEWVNLFANAHLNLTYSIDAVTKTTYEKIRRPARFESLQRSLQIVNELREHSKDQLKLSLNVVVMRSNYKELQLFPDFCKEYGFSCIRFDYIRLGRPDLGSEEDIFYANRDEEALEYLKITMPQIEQRSRDLNILCECTFKPLLSLSRSNSLTAFRSETCIENEHSSAFPGVLKCKVPWRAIWIDIGPIGDVRPGCLCPHSIGNIFDSSLEEVWNSDTMQLYRKKLKEEGISNWCSQDCRNNTLDPGYLEGVL